MLIKNYFKLSADRVDTRELTNNNYISTENLKSGFNGFISASTLPKGSVIKVIPDDILLSNIRPYFRKGLFSTFLGGCSTDVLCLRKYSEGYDSKFVFYCLQSDKFMMEFILSSKGTKMPRGDKNVLLNYNLPDISLPVQQHIVNLLGSIDDKIENNEQILLKIDEIATLLYKKECDESCTVVELGNYITNYDKQRKPLSSRERDSLAKIYPYYGATEILDYVDSYLFDGDFVLLGEDGTVIDNNGHPIIQRVKQKFWANNHTHILQGTNGVNNNILEVVLKNTNVKSIVTGAVQPKINQANMNSLKIKLPSNLKKLTLMLEPLFVKKFELMKINQKLSQGKQLYLKKFFG